MQHQCLHCDKTFHRRSRRLRKYCSHKCYASANQGERHHKYKGGWIQNGYRMVCINGKTMCEHRYLMEQHLSRSLHPREQVHHKDGNKLNNAIDNLEVLWIDDHARKYCNAKTRRRKGTAPQVQHRAPNVKRPDQTCERCGRTYAPKKPRQQFCSTACSAAQHSGSNHPCFKGGWIRPDGYRGICVQRRPMLEHRHLMEVALGRKLLTHEIVHHKDGNPLNNEPSNLELLNNQTEHRRRHTRFYRDQTHKQCSQCHKIKPRADFYPQNSNRRADPHHSWCKECHKARVKADSARRRLHD